jgi:hypothetical protein
MIWRSYFQIVNTANDSIQWSAVDYSLCGVNVMVSSEIVFDFHERHILVQKRLQKSDKNFILSTHQGVLKGIKAHLVSEYVLLRVFLIAALRILLVRSKSEALSLNTNDGLMPSSATNISKAGIMDSAV